MARTTVVLTALLLGVARTSCAANDTGSAESLRSLDRFRRLIPYMTFYFAQENVADDPPQYESQMSRVPVFTMGNVPQYPGNLATLPPYPSPKLSPLQAYLLTPRPFTPAKTRTYLVEPPTKYVYQVQPAKTHATSPRPTPKPVSLLQILYLLQMARKLPQSAGVSGQETLAQIVDILHRANRISPETEATLAKIFRDMPSYRKAGPAPVISVNGAAGINSPTKAYAPSTAAFVPVTADTTPRPFSAAASPTAILAPRPANVVLVPTSSPGNYAYSATPKLQQPLETDVNVPRKLPKVRPPVNIAQVTSARPLVVPDSANEVQGLDYDTKTATPAADEFPSYNYAPKLPQTFYGHKSHVQTYPDPYSTGSTPGTPGVDYPTYYRIPETKFSCKNQRYKGFFGDPDTSCQVWHYCDLNGGQASFLCPNGTIFSQVALTCDWWFNVRCASTTQLYVLNERLYKYILPVTPSFPEDFTGPVVDHYLTLKFKEIELKNKEKEKNKDKNKEKQKE